MKKINWILFVSFRYLKRRSSRGSLGPVLLAVSGIAIGVMSLISVLGVMNGFQLGFIEDIININSFHIRVYSNSTEPDSEFVSNLKNIDGILSVLPFIDIQTLIKGEFTDFEAVNIRAVPGNIQDYDQVMADQLNIISGSINLNRSDSIILGNQLAIRLGVGIGDRISIVSMEGSNFKTLKPSEKDYKVSGIFQSGYYSFDRSMGFILIPNSNRLVSGKEQLIYGIKLDNKYKDAQILDEIKKNIGSSYKAVSWRDFNSSFFGALKTEKNAMMLVIGLIFIVVGINIKHSLERSVVERKEEIGIMVSLGANNKSVRNIFIIEGFLIGLFGSIIGLLIGLFVSLNINKLFPILQFLINVVLKIVQYILSPFSIDIINSAVISATANYYITEIPVRIIYREIIFIFLFAVISSTWAAYSASKLVTLYKPAEVLRYE